MPRDSVWYRIGYAFENARHGITGAAAASRRLPSPAELKERLEERRGTSRRGSDEDRPSRRRSGEGRPSPSGRPPRGSADAAKTTGAEAAVEVLLAGAAGSLVARLLNLWPGRGKAGPLAWARGAAAGAGATLVAELVRPLMGSPRRLPVLDDDLADAILAGAGRGLVYAAVLEPRLPGPTPLRGAAYGALEYAVSPWGGMGELLGPANPGRKIPVLGPLLEEGEGGGEASLTEHVAFGVALALFYGRTVYRHPRDSGDE